MGENQALLQIDARGLLCPEPVLRLRAALKSLAIGEQVELLSTDPLAHVDVSAFCMRGKHLLNSHQKSAGVDYFVIERGT